MERLLEHLGELCGQQFDHRFLALMPNHHLGAIQMSEMLSRMSGGQGMMGKAKDALS